MHGSKGSMETNSMIRTVNFLLLSAVLLRGHGVSAKSPTNIAARNINFWPKTRVLVYNNLGENINLSLHCKSKDNDLGHHLLQNGGFFQWKFHPNFIGTTTFSCRMKWRNVRGTFDIYVAKRDSERCLDCVWKVTQNGVRGYSQEGGVEQIWFRWVPKPPT